MHADYPSLLASLPSLAELKFFYELANYVNQELSLKEAATRLGCDRTALYRRLDQFERKVSPPGARWNLVERATKMTPRLTDEGKEVFRDTKKVLDFYLTRFSRHARMAERITIGATNAINNFYLPFVLGRSRFLERHPEITVQIFEGEWWEILSELRSGNVTFGIGPAIPAGHHYEREKLGDVGRVLVYHPDHPRFSTLSPTGPFDLSLLAEETVFTLPDIMQIGTPMEGQLPEPVPGRGRRIVLPTYSQMRIWVKHNLGVAIMHDRAEVPGEERLGQIDLSAQLGKIGVELYLPAGWSEELSPAALELIKHAREAWPEQSRGV